ncbi:MAG: UDP-N-acetylmuramoyl-L-alanine--D-glutamate ligase [Desulfobulbus propionicus]|nr:MAG: UDP-N-acetylmuramoyl-L-alanine--D-glutamate ligase [Desulfobulbus propionicus]
MQLVPGTVAAVLGVGTAGLSMVRYLHKNQIQVRASEQRSIEKLDPVLLAELQALDVTLETSGHTVAFLKDVELVATSPGIPLDSPVVKACRQNSIPVIGELALAAGRFAVPVVAVTGSNGKTTVTGLIGHLFQKAGLHPFIGGNIGTPLLDFFNSSQAYDVAVLELSSFQLDLAGAFRPDIGVLLNISPDHLDRYSSFADYLHAKYRLLSRQRPGDRAVIGHDDTLARRVPLPEAVERYTFGAHRQSDACVVGTSVHLRLEERPAEIYALAGSVLETRINRGNAAAALLAARLLGVRPEAIQAGLADYRPPPHRMERVATINGVTYINDSKATNVGAMEAALQSCDSRVVLVAGGRDKGGNFAALKELVRRKVSYLVLIGEAGQSLAAAFEGVVPCSHAKGMDDAVTAAKTAAMPGDTVLLAPGCASFDQFKGYAERGEVFRDCVLKGNTASGDA